MCSVSSSLPSPISYIAFVTDSAYVCVVGVLRRNEDSCFMIRRVCMLYCLMRSPTISTAFVTDSEFVCGVCIVSMGVCV